MGINGIEIAGYPVTGYAAGKAERNAESVEANAPEEVKQAWLEAAKEVSANGLGIRKNGMLSHISKMMMQKCNKMVRLMLPTQNSASH